VWVPRKRPTTSIAFGDKDMDTDCSMQLDFTTLDLAALEVDFAALIDFSLAEDEDFPPRDLVVATFQVLGRG